MRNIVKCCVILHKAIIEKRDRDGFLGTKNIVSVDLNTEVTPIRVIKTLSDPFEEAEIHRQSTDRVADRMDHEMFTNALADDIWEKFDNSEMNDFIEEVVVEFELLKSTSNISSRGRTRGF